MIIKQLQNLIRAEISIIDNFIYPSQRACLCLLQTGAARRDFGKEY